MKKIFLFIAISLSLSWAGKAEDLQKIEELRREIKVLEAMKLRKLDSLESAEATRWNARYEQREVLKQKEDESKIKETEYSRVAGDISRLQEDLISMRNLTEEENAKTESKQEILDGYGIQIKQSLEKITESLGSDFPVQIAQRTASLNEGLLEFDKDDKNYAFAQNEYFSDRISRLEMTLEQSVATKASVFPDGKERTVWSVQLGTIFLADVSKEGAEVQSLFRTGALQGKLFAWKTKFQEEYKKDLISLAQNGEAQFAEIPLDLLQNGKLGRDFLQVKELSALERFKVWFATGGLVMYPLFGCALLALILAVERLSLYTRRKRNLEKARKDLLPLIYEERWEDAVKYCNNHRSGLGRAISEVIKKRDSSREATEQAVKQILLAEVPNLEKRLSLVSALGASAPLMGLLGTVSGMITLFKVITDVGTNDARILAGGISEALVTTQTGLIVAIPILLVHGFLTESLDGLLARLNQTVMEALNSVWPEGRKERNV